MKVKPKKKKKKERERENKLYTRLDLKRYGRK